jgi:hypothetical protein
MNQQGTVVRRWQTPDWVIWLIALVGPAVLTAVLLGITWAEKRNYVFLYLGLIATVGVARGLWPAPAMSVATKITAAGALCMCFPAHNRGSGS